MQNLVGLVRRCADDYGMLQPGDRVAVGVSGGKDSLTLLVLLAALRKYHPSRFDLHAVTVDMGLAGMDFTQVEALCHRLEVPYTRVETQIAPIIFDYRQEKNPCSMCAKMRRGALNQALLELGCNKVALGHHYDDAVETFFLSLFYEGRLSCFQPVTNLDRTGVIQIRPMLYLSEKTIAHFAAKERLPVVHNPCPVVSKDDHQYHHPGTGPSGLCNALPGGEWPGETHCFDPGGERLRQQNAEGRISGGTGCHGKDATTIFSTVCGCLGLLCRLHLP